MRRTILPCLLPCLLLAAPGLAAQQAWSSDTYGAPRGAKAQLRAGLVLELADGHGASPTLRLVGGAPGHRAAIMLSPERGAGTVGELSHIDHIEQSLEGRFDERGVFAVPLDDVALPGAAGWYAQGIELRESAFAAAGLETSQGLVAGYATAPETPELIGDGAFAWHHEPVRRDDLEQARRDGGLVEVLRTALNSPGDSIALSGEGFYAVIRMKGREGELAIERTSDDAYELSVAAAAVPGVTIGLPKELGVTVNADAGARAVLRFHSLPGLLRLLNAWQLAATAGDGDLAQGAATAAAQALLATESVGAEARERLDTLRGKLRAARRALAQVENSLPRGVRTNKLTRKTVARLEDRVANTERALARAQREVQAAIARAGVAAELAWQLTQVEQQLLEHFVALELTLDLENSTGIGLPIECPKFELGAWVERAVAPSLRIDLAPREGGMRTYTIQVSRQYAVGGSAALGAGYEAQAALGVTGTWRFGVDDETIVTSQAALEVALDAQAGAGDGASMVPIHGERETRGRRMHVAGSMAELLPALVEALGSGVEPAQVLQLLAETVPDVSVEYGQQDRSGHLRALGLAGSTGVVGGGAEVRFERVDQGPGLVWDVTLGEALEAMLRSAE